MPVDVAAAMSSGTIASPGAYRPASEVVETAAAVPSGTCVGAVSASVAELVAAAVASGTRVGAVSASVALEVAAAAPSGTSVSTVTAGDSPPTTCDTWTV